MQELFLSQVVGSIICLRLSIEISFLVLLELLDTLIGRKRSKHHGYSVAGQLGCLFLL